MKKMNNFSLGLRHQRSGDLKRRFAKAVSPLRDNCKGVT